MHSSRPGVKWGGGQIPDSPWLRRRDFPGTTLLRRWVYIFCTASFSLDAVACEIILYAIVRRGTWSTHCRPIHRGVVQIRNYWTVPSGCNNCTQMHSESQHARMYRPTTWHVYSTYIKRKHQLQTQCHSLWWITDSRLIRVITWGYGDILTLLSFV